jgi:hypothetical protein
VLILLIAIPEFYTVLYDVVQEEVTFTSIVKHIILANLLESFASPHSQNWLLEA